MGKQNHVARIRGMASSSKAEEEEENDPMRNLAYVVNSANDNITSLSRTVKQQEKELAEKTEQAAALQRNYETLSRIRQADQKEFMLLKAHKVEQERQLQQLQDELGRERAKVEEFDARLQETAAAQSELQRSKLRLQEAERERDDKAAEATQAKREVAVLSDSSKTLKLNLEKLTRVQHEMLQRSRKADEATRQLQTEKEAAEKEQHRVGSKLAVQERQLRTFLEANEALENDLREQMQLVQQLERRKQEQEAEKQTIEAYYEARLEEMQTQYDRLLADVESRAGAQKSA